MLEKLERHRQQVVLFDAMQLFPTRHGDRHGQGYAALWTCQLWKKDPIFYPNGPYPSFDYYVGQKAGRLWTPRHPNVYLGAHSHGGDGNATYGTDGSLIKGIRNPYEAYATLFDGGAAAGQKMTPEAVRTRLELRKSVLDSVAKDLTAFGKKLSAEDRKWAEAQLDAVRSLETRLSANTGAACTGPKLPAQGGLDLNDGGSHPEICKMHFDLIAAAFACDLTRVVHFNFGGQHKPQKYVGSSKDVHGMSHDEIAKMVEAKHMWFGFLADFLDKLAAIPEPGPKGQMGTMLDNTVVVTGSEISTGHIHKRMPFATIGGRNLGIATGRMHHLTRGKPGIPNLLDEGGEPHNRMLVGVLNALGIPDERYGLKVDGLDQSVLPGFLA
jgi:hypothetical protein